jgi:hypothetical protein
MPSPQPPYLANGSDAVTVRLVLTPTAPLIMHYFLTVEDIEIEEQI